MTPAEEIKAKLDLVEIVRNYVPNLKAVGSNFQARCPFHQEKSASFVVSPSKQIWHCFGCGKGGDLFRFIMEIDGLSFVEALRQLAPKAGVTLRRVNPAEASQRNRLLDIVEAAAARFHDHLLNLPEAEEARQYLLAQRGLNQATVDGWRLGYSRDSWDDLLNFLLAKGFKQTEINQAGLLAASQDGRRQYDRFRGRVMFPLADVNGQIVGFTARILPSAEKKAGDDLRVGKYINSPQSFLYDKSKLLFGLDKAKLAIKQAGFAILVEGQMDCLTAHQFNFANTVASSGTALTGEQIKLLERYTDNFILALDADAAGQAATSRGYELINQLDETVVASENRFGRAQNMIDPWLSHKKNIRVLVLPVGKDPDDCLRHDPEGWKKALTTAQPIMAYFFDKFLTNFNPEVLADRQRVVQGLLPLILQRPSAVERDFWLKTLADRTRVAETSLREEAGKLVRAVAPVGKVQPTSQPAPTSRAEILSEILLALLLRYPVLWPEAINFLTPEQLFGLANQSIYRAWAIYYNKISSQADRLAISTTAFEGWWRQVSGLVVDNVLFSHWQKLLILSERQFMELELSGAGAELLGLTSEIKKYYLQARRQSLAMTIAQAERELVDATQINSLMSDLQQINFELKQLDE